MKNFYSILGVSTNATADEIRAAYRRRVGILHPDRFDKETQTGAWYESQRMLKELKNDPSSGFLVFRFQRLVPTQAR